MRFVNSSIENPNDASDDSMKKVAVCMLSHLMLLIYKEALESTWMNRWALEFILWKLVKQHFVICSNSFSCQY